jgi:hypothetical protein
VRKVKVAAAAQLGRRHSRQPVGYRVLDINRRPFDGEDNEHFDTVNVAETAVPGYYIVIGGVDVPPAGGYIVWGFEDRVLAEATIAPVVIQ